MNEEVARETVNLAVRSAKVTAGTLVRGLAKAHQHHKQKKATKQQKKVYKQQMKKNEHKHGKQTIKQLIRQDQGVASMDVGDSGMRDFKRIANKYGVDFAIVKDKSCDPPKYVTFFKAKDADAITQILKEYSAKQIKKEKKAEKKQEKKRESVLQKLKANKEKADKTPKKEIEKKKVQTR